MKFPVLSILVILRHFVSFCVIFQQLHKNIVFYVFQMGKSVPYQCPRCGYSTRDKRNMRRHLFLTQRMCPGSLHVIVLTDEIKNHVLENRVYNVDVQNKPPANITFNQTINNYNQILNYVNKMDVVDKITKYTVYKQTPLIEFEDQIQEQYKHYIEKLENNKFIDFQMDERTLMEAIDTLTHNTDASKMNVVHDVLSDRVRLFQDGEWVSLMFDAGIDELISRVKSSYLDSYETYLIRRYMQCTSAFKKQQLMERLQDYYKFIVCFELNPVVIGQTDCDILENGTDCFDIEERFMDVFRKIRDDIKHCDVVRLRRQVANVVKKNSKASMAALNIQMLELIQADEHFKEIVMERFKGI